MCFIDYSKLFDAVKHEILLDGLSAYKTDGSTPDIKQADL